MTDAADVAFMCSALALARRGLGRVWPNPAVGCVLVRDGSVVGRGWTQPGGRPHAETDALARAGAAARGATAFVTLEPCDHFGVTSPCSLALIEAGVARVVVAVEDPDPRVNGRGIARLQAAGIEVSLGACREEAKALNEGFFLRITHGRPLVTLKLATSLDGRIATATGDSKWITGERARAAAHLLRAEHDAILVGSGTALADDAALTCRLPGMADRSPVRVVADGRLRIGLDAALVRTARAVPTWVLTTRGGVESGDPHEAKRAALMSAGVAVLEVVCGTDGRLEPGAMVAALAARGITRLMIEGGGDLAAAFVRAGLVDHIAWFHAPKLLGGDALPAVGGLSLQRVADAPAFHLRWAEPVGKDSVADLWRAN